MNDEKPETMQATKFKVSGVGTVTNPADKKSIETPTEEKDGVKS